MNILSKLLNKKGIKDVSELSAEERIVFDNYERVLSKESLNVEDVKKFLEIQIGSIETKWKDYNYGEDKKAKLLPYHTCYKTLLQAINAPLAEKEALEKYLNQLI